MVPVSHAGGGKGGWGNGGWGKGGWAAKGKPTCIQRLFMLCSRVHVPSTLQGRLRRLDIADLGGRSLEDRQQLLLLGLEDCELLVHRLYEQGNARHARAMVEALCDCACHSARTSRCAVKSVAESDSAKRTVLPHPLCHGGRQLRACVRASGGVFDCKWAWGQGITSKHCRAAATSSSSRVPLAPPYAMANNCDRSFSLA
jgi:hypothetical protein